MKHRLITITFAYDLGQYCQFATISATPLLLYGELDSYDYLIYLAAEIAIGCP